MSKNKVLMLTISSLLLFAFQASAIEYVQCPPLSQSVSSQVFDVQDTGGIWNVPLITWGGDIATVLANGNSRQTAPGSILDQKGLRVNLFREDDFKKQVQGYMQGKTPFLRGTMGMINMASEVISRDERTRPVLIYQMTWSTGGDTLVVKQGINTVADLKGKTIALQCGGPHVDYLLNLLRTGGLSLNDVRIKWTKDLTGTDNSSAAALYDSSIDAVMAITPDALTLTSNGTVGSGGSKSVKGARILLSTKTANRIISDVYVVRNDFFMAHEEQVRWFVHGLMLAEEKFREIVQNKHDRKSEYRNVVSSAAEILMDSKQAFSDTEAMYNDCEYVGFSGNEEFFTNQQNPRNMQNLTMEIQAAFRSMGLMSSNVSLNWARWDFDSLKPGLKNTTNVFVPTFNESEVAKVVARKQIQGTLKEGELFSFEVYFSPNQNTFPATQYSEYFAKVIKIASTFGGAVIIVEGHSDPLGYLKRKKTGETQLVLRQIMQATKNLSLTRANAVRESVVAFAKEKGIVLDNSQFTVVGHGISLPKTGMCGQDPCPPKTEQEWKDNMRVEFRIIQVEAEANVFKPL